MDPGWSRRQLLSWGATAFGLSLPRLWEARANTAEAVGRGGKAKSIVILYLSGGPSQLDMWDMKPRSPEEVRGTFRPISTPVAGIQICEHLPRMARIADRYTIIRSMSHNEADHLRAGYWVMTGGRLTRAITAFSGMDRNDHPHVGGVVSRHLPAQKVPAFVTIPEFVSPRGVPRPGQHAGFLGTGHDPYLIHSDPNLPDYHPGPIYGSAELAGDRIDSMRTLLTALEGASAYHDHTSSPASDPLRERAFDIITSANVRQAFDLSRESAAVRDRYGRHFFGQSTLVARRLIEAGVRLVQVNYIRHDNGKGGQGYDSHSVPPSPAHLTWLRNELLPPTDAAFASLVEDLEDRGLLEETLVMMMGEFGRTPKFNSHAGRDHWPNCYSLVMAGGGVRRGYVHGQSDRHAAEPTTDPVSPDDLLATVYHLLAIDTRATHYDLDNRPHVLCSGQIVRELLS
jgi:hypothetical protein